MSSFLTAGNIKFLILHSGKSEDSIKNFFHEVFELYTKVNPHEFFTMDCTFDFAILAHL